jgi:hypothetical protein
VLRKCSGLIFSDSETALNPKSVILFKRYLSRNRYLEDGLARDLFPAAGFPKPATDFRSSKLTQRLKLRQECLAV